MFYILFVQYILALKKLTKSKYYYYIKLIFCVNNELQSSMMMSQCEFCTKMKIRHINSMFKLFE